MPTADAAVAEGLSALLDALQAPALASPPARLTALKSKLGRRGVADRLKLTEHELSRFEAALAEVQRWSEAAPSTPRRQDFLELAALAALQWLELVSPKLGVAAPANPLTSALTDEAAAARVRALELVIRELVHESYRTQEALLARLREVFRADAVDKWSRAAGGSDVLTGMSFGDLAGFFVAREEYPRWQPTLEVDLWLAMLRERRKTLREYLDALRLARNALAHHKPLTATQRVLVERYSDEIFGPIAKSWAEGRTTVNPKAHLEASSDGLNAWVAGLSDEVAEIREDLSGVKQDLAATKKDVSALEGALVLVLLSGLFLIGSVVMTAVYSLGAASTGKVDVAAAGVAVARSMRGMLAAALTFGLAVVRIGLNVAWFRSGHGAAARSWLTGRRALVPLGAWTLLCLVFYAAPLRFDSVQAQFDEAGIQVALVTLEDDQVARYLASGGDPNKQFNGQSALELALIGQSMSQQGDEPRRERIVKQLIASGARVTEKERKLAKVMEREQLLLAR